VAQQPGDEPLGHVRQAAGSVEVDERVGVTLEERHVGVHARSLDAGQWLGHEAGEHALLSAISLTTSRTVMMVSAIVSASVYRRSISC